MAKKKAPDPYAAAIYSALVNPAPSAPAAPAHADPFFSSEDLVALNDFNTNYLTQLANIDFELGNLQTDTAYQTGQVNKQATVDTSAATDAMAARGLFRSSIKDAALYDIEAQRSLQTKFLNDKLQSAVLNAGTQKRLLGNSKAEFDKAMLQRQGENARRVNDVANQAYAQQKAASDAAMAAWQKAQPKAAAPKVVASGPQSASKPKLTQWGGRPVYGWGK